MTIDQKNKMHRKARANVIDIIGIIAGTSINAVSWSKVEKSALRTVDFMFDYSEFTVTAFMNNADIYNDTVKGAKE